MLFRSLPLDTPIIIVVFGEFGYLGLDKVHGGSGSFVALIPNLMDLGGDRKKFYCRVRIEDRKI